MTARSYPKANLSSRRARAALQMLLTGCAPERLAGFTAAGLSAAYNVPAKTVETMLAAARQGRML